MRVCAGCQDYEETYGAQLYVELQVSKGVLRCVCLPADWPLPPPSQIVVVKR